MAHIQIQNVRNEPNWKYVLDVEPSCGYETIRIAEAVNIPYNEEEIQAGSEISFDISGVRSEINGQILNINRGELGIRVPPVRRIIKNIRDDFDLFTDRGQGAFVFPDNIDDEPVFKNNLTPADLDLITDEIANYTRNHQGEFNLSETAPSLTTMPRGFPRPWYSPLNLERDKLTYNAYNMGGGEQAGRMRYIEKGEGGQRRQIFPNFFSENQYERLKNALGDNVSCKFPGCYNNYLGFGQNETEETRVVNGRCGYHRRIENGDQTPPPYQEAEEAENQTSGNINSESERKRIIRNELNNNDELKRLLGANTDNISRESFVEISLENWINADGTINLEEIKNFFRGNYWNVPEPEQTFNGEGAEDNSGSESQNSNSGREPTSDPLLRVRTQACQEISNTLNQEPKISNSDLAENNRGWKEQINIADNENDIINIRDRVLVDIAAKRKAKKEAENITNNLETEGKDIKNNLEAVIKEFDQKIGLDKLWVIHVNDSLQELGTKIDRHENIGYGNIGFEVLKKIIWHPKFNGIPKILETPRKREDFSEEIRILKGPN